MRVRAVLRKFTASAHLSAVTQMTEGFASSAWAEQDVAPFFRSLQKPGSGSAQSSVVDGLAGAEMRAWQAVDRIRAKASLLEAAGVGPSFCEQVRAWSVEELTRMQRDKRQAPSVRQTSVGLP